MSYRTSQLDSTRRKISDSQKRRHDPNAAAAVRDYLDGTMSPSDLVYVLEHLRYEGRGSDSLASLHIDREAARFLIDALQRKAA